MKTPGYHVAIEFGAQKTSVGDYEPFIKITQDETVVYYIADVALKTLDEAEEFNSFILATIDSVAAVRESELIKDKH